jgi:Tol biopolymer transport system component
VDEASDIYPIWSADGRTIVFSSNRGGGLDLYREATDGSGHPQLVYADRHMKQATSLTPDGKYLLYWTSDPQTGLDMWVLPDPLTATPGKPFPFRQTRFNELGGQFSPDGRWVAYMTDESGQFEICVAPFPGPGPRRQVSMGGGFWAGWGRDGKEVLFSSYSSELMAAAAHVGPGGVFESGKPTPLVRLALIGPEFYDVSADGQRIVAVAPQRSQKEETLSVVQNWTAGLKK